ncbi:glycosyltransferase family 4 protein [Candidatus Uhrbacteria bacterium]|nr:glycosyltransferase family 4 protein [Candidatus Uhrbacteria bacterium]
MKIGILSNLYPPYTRGGAELIAWRTAHELHVRGHDVFAFTTMPFEGMNSFYATIRDKYVESVYRFFPFNTYHLLADGTHWLPTRALWHLIDMYGPQPAREFARVCEVEQPDIIISHNLKGLGLQIVPEIRRQHLPQVHILHDVQLTVPSGLMLHGHESEGFNRPFIRRWYEWQVQAIFKSPELIVSPSRFLAGLYRDRGFFPNSRVEILPNPVPNLPKSDRTIRPSTGPIEFLFVGQLVAHKGIEFLWSVLSKWDVPFRLHVAGEGALTQWMLKLADTDPRVIYHGYIPLEKLNDLFSISDAVVVPSLCYENSPTIIYECFGSGVPVIASDIGGIGELVRQGENGFLFIPGDKKGLLAALRAFVANRESFRHAASRISASVDAFTVGKYVDQLEMWLEELVEKKMTG